MRDQPPGETEAVEALLRDLEEAKQRLLDIVAQVTDQEFVWQSPAGDSIKQTLEKAADDINFFYGWLVTRARGLAPIPCLQPADFLSIREAAVVLQVVHRRFANRLHDLRPEELETIVSDEGLEPRSLREVLAGAAAHYRQRAEAVQRLRQAFREAQP
jgi:hypothetical protein